MLSPRQKIRCALGLLTLCGGAAFAADAGFTVTGSVRDAETGALLPARVYVRSADGTWRFLKSAAAEGTAQEFRHKVGEKSVEMFTTLSAHPFTAILPPGRHTISAEHGKEFLPDTREIEVQSGPVQVELKLRRWIDMAGRGWFSGDTHSHLPLNQTTNVLMAEDLNIGFPLSHWVTDTAANPATANKISAPTARGEALAIDPNHLIYPLNTEYEIFSAAGKSHTLGAFLVLGQKTPLDLTVPPVGPVVARARAEGALIDLEKHSWPWSVAMTPVLGLDLFELANNHLWRAEFGFPQWTVSAAGKYMKLDMDARGFTEWGWIDFGFQTYYAFLNCGFRVSPTAGSGYGVHPVPMGFGRVYVHQPNGFTYESWMRGLKEGRSFVTTGPMLFATVNGREPGAELTLAEPNAIARVVGSVESASPIERIEIILNGRVATSPVPANRKAADGIFRNSFEAELAMEGSGWVAVRVFEANGGRRNRFAHTGPVRLNLPGHPLRPRREEIDYLIQRVQEEIARNQTIIAPAALDEYRQALKIYQDIAATVP